MPKLPSVPTIIVCLTALGPIGAIVAPQTAFAQQTVAQVSSSGQAVAQQKQELVHIVKKSELRNEAVPAGTHLEYYGGPVISNVQVVVVYWGPNVKQPVTKTMPNFYKGVTKSVFFDLLSEYSTNLASGSNQSVGRGSFVAAITINPAVFSNTISDSQVQTELLRQMNTGGLPQPKYDLAGNIDTLYMIYFPPGLVITKDGGRSCFTFCGYHGTTLFNGKFVPYGVIPDFSVGSGCDLGGCGVPSGADVTQEINNVTAVSSHELAESVTDVGIGRAAALGFPVAWYDPSWVDPNTGNLGAEIGDICAAIDDQVSTPAGVITIQRQFSNIVGGCIASGVHPNFDLTGPSTVNPGSPFSLTLSVNNPVAGQGRNTSFVGTMHVTSSDASAILPADYSFTPDEQGIHSFPVTLQKNGTQTITARDTVNGAITAQITLTSVSAFSMSATPTALTIPAEASGNITLSTAVVAGIPLSVNLSLAGLPAGATASFSPSSLASGQSSTLTINTGAAVPGFYQLTATGGAGAEQHTASIQLTIVDRVRGGDLRTWDSADRLSWTYEPKVVNGNNVEFKICKAPSITWWKELVVRSGNFIFADLGLKDRGTCTSQQVATSSLQHGFQMELWKAKFLGISTQVKVMPADTFGYLAPGSRVTVTWLKD